MSRKRKNYQRKNYQVLQLHHQNFLIDSKSRRKLVQVSFLASGYRTEADPSLSAVIFYQSGGKVLSAFVKMKLIPERLRNLLPSGQDSERTEEEDFS